MTTFDPTTDPHAEEAKRRWGHTEAYRQSRERVKKMSKDDFKRVQNEGDAITKAIAALKVEGATPADPRVQGQVAKHYAWLRHFYEPNPEMYRGLGSMYVDDPRFTATYEKYAPGMAVFMRDAMHAFCDAGVTP
jgi:MerR family transcriptional regulator, thiopeptide resistance regulator